MTEPALMKWYRTNHRKESATKTKFINRRHSQVQQVEEHSVSSSDPADRSESLARIAFVDSDTGFANDSAFRRKLEYEARRACRYKRPLAMVMIRFDRHEELEQQFSSLITRDLLILLANTIQSCIRETDLPFRLEGNAVAILLPETNLAGALKVACRLKSELKKQRAHFQFGSHRLTVSIGISAIPEVARDTQGMLDMAEESIAAAVRAGGNKIIWRKLDAEVS